MQVVRGWYKNDSKRYDELVAKAQRCQDIILSWSGPFGPSEKVPKIPKGIKGNALPDLNTSPPQEVKPTDKSMILTFLEFDMRN